MKNQTKDPGSMDWKKILDEAVQACLAGRKILLDYYGHLQKIEEKHQAGLVSEADKESERVISELLKKILPQSEFLGEESYFDGARVSTGRAGKEGRWILDPLDGTTNYIHQFPLFCISLALEVSADLKIAVIDVPLLNETYTAIRGQGAWVNGQRLRVSQTSEIERSLLSTGFFAEDIPVLEEQLKIFSHLVRKARGVRRSGSAAYDLCQVARGVFDAYWEKNLKPWDTAAGQLLVEEAGGVLLTYDGRPHHPYENSLISGNQKMASLIQKSVNLLV
ncbi:MAG: inositol monophosphatase family protein [Bdellovibrionota bacterium]